MPPAVTRRTLTKGAAWSAPVVALAATAPAASASAACAFDLDIDLTTQENRHNYAYIVAELTLLAGSCGTTDALNSPLQVTFTIDDLYYGWGCDDLDPDRGYDTGTFTAQTLHTFARPGDWNRLYFTAQKHGSAPPISFTFSADHLNTTSVTAVPT